MITKISHVTFFVTDQQKAFEFYVNTLHFSVRTDTTMANGFRWLTVSPPDQPELEIALLNPLSGGMGFDEEAKQAFRILLDKNALGAGVFQTPDCRATYTELKEKGVGFRSEPREQFYGTEAVMQDGLGNWFSVTQRRPEE